MNEYIEKPDMQYILHIKSDKKVEKRLIDHCLESVVDVFEDTGLTADVQPAVHAEWIGFTRSAFLCCDPTGEPIFRDTTVWKCSHCGRNTVVRDNFCPNCGARMDGDNNG